TAGARRARAVPVRAQRQAARAGVERAGRRAAPTGDGLHRPHGRCAGGQRRPDPLERGAHRARGDHPRLPGDLLRLRLRARPCLEPGPASLRLAQVARTVEDIGPALDRALAERPDPDGSFARRPSTASLIMGGERRITPLPAWRVRSARAITGTAAVLLIAGWTLTTGASYSL